MKKIPLTVIFFLLLAKLAFAETLTFVADPFCPYVCDEGADQGIMFDIVRAVYQAQGYKVKTKIVPWKRAIDQVKNREATGILGATSSTPDLLFPKEEIAVYIACFYVKKGNLWRYEDADSLSKITLGLVGGYDYGFGPVLDKHIQNNPTKVQFIFGLNADERNLMKIQIGRIDATITDRNIGGYLIKKNGWDNQIHEVSCFSDDKASIYVGFLEGLPESAHYAGIFDRGMAELRRTGKLQVILEKYGITDWK